MDTGTLLGQPQAPKLPPYRAFKVYENGDSTTVYAHTIQFLEDGLVAFFDIVVVEGVEVGQMRRVFKHWDSVEELITTSPTALIS